MMRLLFSYLSSRPLLLLPVWLSSIFCGSFSLAQPFPSQDFISPMDTPLYLSAPFGSLRENHFHSGMDIRTYEKEGLPVYAVADGYVSRIKVASGGYGKAIYVDHPNGYTSVYAHLQRYEGEAAAYIKRYQYEHETAEFDHFPGRGRIPVKQGQLIGWSGNSGSSTGPHLHFEIRHTRSEEPMNPQLFGIAAVDLFGPFLKSIAVYDLNGNTSRLVGNLPVTTQNTFITDSGTLLNDTLKVPYGMIGIGMDASDYLVNENKEYSIYSSDLYYDGTKRFSFRLDRTSFEYTRCVNVHIDYAWYKKTGDRIQKCFLEDGNLMPVYPYMRNKGKLAVTDTLPHLVKLRIGDFAGNAFVFYAVLQATQQQAPQEKPCNNQTLYPLKTNLIKDAGMQAQIPAGILYDTVFICTSPSSVRKGMLSPVFRIHEPLTPLHKSMTVSIKLDSFYRKNTLLLAYVNDNGTFRSAGGEYKNGWVSARASQFGNYAVVADSVSPEISLLNVGRNGTCKDTFSLRIRITDNFSGIDAYKVTINGKWVLAEYDAKSNLLTYEFDDNTLFNIKQNLTVIVADNKQNTTTLQQEITFIK